MDAAALERNLALYRVYYPLSRLLFKAPVFFLYLNERFAVDEILRLEAVYYLAVVLWEVPSGYLSDRVGRVLTLRLSTASFVVAFTLFLVGEGFAAFAAAQAILAFAFASRSGTDEAFHYDSLVASGHQADYASREARLVQSAYLAAAASAFVGGLTGWIDLAIPYALSLLSSLLVFAVALRMREPPRHRDGWAPAFTSQLGTAVRLHRTPLLAWLLAYVVLQVSLEHIPYEFAQPYVAAVLGESARAADNTPLATGLLATLFAIFASLASGQSPALMRRFGVAGTLLGVTAFQVIIIVSMAWVVHPLVIVLLAFRTCHSAVSRVVVTTAVAPRVPQAQRATVLSLHSLLGRLGYGLLLFGLAGLAGSAAEADAAALSRMLGAGAAVGALGWVALLLTRRSLRRRDDSS